jgi:cell division septal protein FtsQ
MGLSQMNTGSSSPRLPKSFKGPRRKTGAKKRKIAARLISGGWALGCLCVLGTVFASGYGCWNWMCGSHLFRVSKVHISGCNHLSHEEILRLSGVTPQTNLLALDLESTAASIRVQPWVRAVEIRRKFPDQLFIDLKEHNPVASLTLDSPYLVGETGEIFLESDSGEKPALPEIDGLTPEDIKHSRLQGPALRVLDLIAMASKGMRTLGSNNISRIHLEDDGGLLVYTADSGIPVRFGTEDLAGQFARAEKILFQLYRSGMYDKIAMVELDYGPGRSLARLK